MRFIIECQEDIHRLVGWYNSDRITAEEYFDAVDQYAARMFEDEVERVSWLERWR